MTKRAPASPRLAWLWIAVAAIAPFLPTLSHQFTFDDVGLVRHNPAVWHPRPSGAWTTPYWPDRPAAGLYRPWITFSYWLNARLLGSAPAGFRLVNLLLHAGVTLLFWLLLRRLFPARRGPALAAALLFAVHPLHVEAIVSIIGRAELWAAFWGLAAILIALPPSTDSSRAHASRRNQPALRIAAAAVIFLLALWSKESAAGLLLLPAALVLGRRREFPRVEAGAGSTRRHWMLVLAAGGLALLFAFLIRSRVLGHIWGLEPPSLADNALAHVGTVERVLSAFGLQWILIGRLLFPWPLAADHSYPQLVPSSSWMLAGGALALLGAAALWWSWRRRDHEVLSGWAILLGGGMVTANVIVPVGTILAERLAYLPSAGALWLLAVLGFRLHERLAGDGASRASAASARSAAGISAPGRALRWLVPALALAWGGLLIGRSLTRGAVWKDDLALFRATVLDSPRSAKAWANLAVALLEQNDLEGSLEASGRSLGLLPGYPPACEVRATALTRLQRPLEAVELLRPALRDPRPRARSLIELGNAYLSLGEGASAESAFAAAARHRPAHDLHVLVGRASALALQKRWDASEAAWSRAAAAAPTNADVRRSWGYALWQSGSPDRAESLYRELLRERPADVAVRNDLAWFLARTGRDREEALFHARAAFASSPTDDHTGTLLLTLARARGCAAARAWADSITMHRPEARPALDRALEELCPPSSEASRLGP